MIGGVERAALLAVLVMVLLFASEVRAEDNPAALIEDKLQYIMIPVVDYEGLSLEKALQYLQKKSVQFDVLEEDLDRKGVKLSFRTDAEGNRVDVPAMSLALTLKDVSLEYALKCVLGDASMKYQVEDHAVVIAPYKWKVQVKDDSAAKIKDKLVRIVIPKLDFQQMPFGEALKILQARSVELDVSEVDPARKGVDFRLQTISGDSGAPVTFSISNASLGGALSLTVAHARLEYKINSKGVVIVSRGTKARTEALAEERRSAFAKKKLTGIILPNVEFKQLPLAEALKILEEKSVEFDVKESDASKKGIKFIVRPVLHGGVNFPIDSVPYHWRGFRNFHEAKITLKLSNTTLAEALKYTASLGGVKFKAEPPQVRLYLHSSHDEDSHHGLYTNVYVLPDWPSVLGESGEAGSAKGKTVKDLLIASGVEFQAGTSAVFNPETSELVVRNTWDQMKLIEVFVESNKGTKVELGRWY